ncbi:MAG: SGNH/GDSL hydrolase family protein [Ktedonobacterales bacterium]
MSIGREFFFRFFPCSFAVRAATAALMTFALLAPANAQFWGDSWGGRQQQQQQQQRQQPYNPFGGWGDRPGGFWGDRQESPRYPRQRERVREPEREEPPDYSHAPPATPRKDATIKILVMGDANADWLAYGLEDAFSEKPEIGIVRKHRTDSGLIRYDQRRDSEWPQAAREIIAAERPKYIVMMVGNNDRQTIREKAPPAAASDAAKKNAQQAAKPNPSSAPATDPEQQPPEQPIAAAHANMTPEQARQASYGPWEFHTDKWELAYIRRIDATIAALKSAGVPVIWVGLPSQRGPKSSVDSSYLNELYRSRAEKAGIVYVDVWDGFVDEAGKFSPQGPDYQGQTRRLRTSDGVHFTKFGARKLAHYVEREIERSLSNQRVPVALPVPIDPGGRTPKGKVVPERPAAGPVVPLTGGKVSSEELLGGGRDRPAVVDPVAIRVLSTGEGVAAPTGRADDFRWPRDIITEPTAPTPAAKR